VIPQAHAKAKYRGPHVETIDCVIEACKKGKPMPVHTVIVKGETFDRLARGVAKVCVNPLNTKP